MNEQHGREERGVDEGEAEFADGTLEQKLIDTFERELSGVEVCDVEAVGRRLSSELESRRESWQELSLELEAAMGIRGGESLFRWRSGGWELDRGSAGLGAAAGRSTQGRPARGRADDCVGKLAGDLVEEERVGAWCWHDASSRPAAALRLTAPSAAGEVELRVSRDQDGRTRVRVAVPPGVREVSLRDRLSDQDLVGSPGVRDAFEFALPPDEVGEFELVMKLDDERTVREHVPVSGR